MDRLFRRCLFAATLMLALPFVEARAESDPDADREAHDYYLKGEGHYAAGRYRKAATAFERAYQLSKRPELLFNIGNAYERLGEYKKAAENLRRYAADPQAKGRDLVRERIGRLEAAHEQQVKESRELQQARLRKEQAERTRAVAPTAAPGESTSTRRLIAYVCLGVGAAALGTSLGLGLAARKAGDDAEENCLNGICLDGAESNIDKQKRLALATDITLGVGLAAAGTGAFLLIYDWLSSGEESNAQSASQPAFSVQPAWSTTGAGLSLAGRF